MPCMTRPLDGISGLCRPSLTCAAACAATTGVATASFRHIYAIVADATRTSATVSNYLGEETLLSLQGTPFEHFTPTKWALYFIERYGQIDGGHHKQWVLDQVARILHGTPVIVKRASWDQGAVRQIEYRVDTGEPSRAYNAWVVDMQGDIDENGEPEYGYDTGIAP